MHRTLIRFALVATIAPPVWAQTPASDLAKPPADARHFVIRSSGGKHGDSWSWVAPDGARRGRESVLLRGMVTELESTAQANAQGVPRTIAVRGFNPSGDAAETLTVENDTARWTSAIDKGSDSAKAEDFYLPFNGPVDLYAWLIERLIQRPDRRLKLLPGGEAHAVELTKLDVGSGPTRQRITLWSVTGINTSPYPMWTDAKGRFFGLAGGFDYLPEAYVSEATRIEQAQEAALTKQAPTIAKLAKTPGKPVAFTNVRTFDADGLRFLAEQTVVVDKGKIVAAGPADSVRIPAGAERIAGAGMTLVPGLWDCHMHVGDDFTGPQELSLGVTSVRDPGNVDRQTIDRRTRIKAGKLLFPHVYPSSLIDGSGPNAAQAANIATNQSEAIAWVDRARANGFTGVKFYGSFDPAWLPAAVAEAHKLGLHVHGHIPHGIRPLVAIEDGYDEVTHINWIMMQAMPESSLADDNGIGRFETPGRYAKDVDLDGPALTEIVSVMARKHIYSDPTMVAFESLYVPDNGDLSPSYAPFVGTMPVVTERGFRAGGFQVPKDLTRADWRASWAKMVGLLTRMHAAGVPIVAGTDGSGIELVRELEIYVEAGFTPAEALAAATIVPARLVGHDRRTGSIQVGKNADLALVEGDPSVRIGDLRQTRIVMLDGRLLDADALRAAAGFSGRPK